MMFAPINFVTTGDNTVITGVAGQSIYIKGLFLVVTTTPVALTFKDSNGSPSPNLTGPFTLAAGTPLVLPVALDELAYYKLAKGGNFVIGQGAGVSQISGSVSFDIY